MRSWHWGACTGECLSKKMYLLELWHVELIHRQGHWNGGHVSDLKWGDFQNSDLKFPDGIDLSGLIIPKANPQWIENWTLKISQGFCPEIFRYLHAIPRFNLQSRALVEHFWTRCWETFYFCSIFWSQIWRLSDLKIPSLTVASLEQICIPHAVLNFGVCIHTHVYVYIYIYVYIYTYTCVCACVECVCIFLRLGHFIISGHLSWMLYRRTISDASWFPAVAAKTKTNNSMSFHRFFHCSGIGHFQFFRVICTSCLLRHLQTNYMLTCALFFPPELAHDTGLAAGGFAKPDMRARAKQRSSCLGNERRPFNQWSFQFSIHVCNLCARTHVHPHA